MKTLCEIFLKEIDSTKVKSEYKAPEAIPFDDRHHYIFLAGSIEMGKAEKWQDKIAKLCSTNSKLVVLNPRRDDWDDSWVQDIADDNFKEQVQWELNSQEKCDEIIMYFDPKTQSPITLLELGLFARSKKLTVCCPDGFWRKGNIQVVCDKYGIPLLNNWEELELHIRKEHNLK